MQTILAIGISNLAGPDGLIIIGVICCVLLGPKLIKGWSKGIIETVKEVNKAKKEITDEVEKAKQTINKL